MAVENGIRPEDMNPDVSSVDVSVPQAPNFEGGAEVLQGPQGGAIVQALTDAMSKQDPNTCLLYTSPSPRDRTRSRMPSSA